MAHHDKRCARGQEPKVDVTFPYCAPNDLVANAVEHEAHPRSRVDRQRVAAKDGDHAQILGTVKFGARADGDFKSRIIVESSLDLSSRLPDERSFPKNAQDGAP